jgi:hypothetical protein
MSHEALLLVLQRTARTAVGALRPLHVLRAGVPETPGVGIAPFLEPFWNFLGPRRAALFVFNRFC